MNDEQERKESQETMPQPEVDIQQQEAPVQPLETTPATSDDLAEAHPLSRAATIRKWFFYILIGGLIVSAVISIIAVLIGEVNDLVSRSLWTTFIMVTHSLLAVAFLSASTNERNTQADGVALNVLVSLTIASFVTAALGVWEVLSGAVVGDLYQLMFYALIADLLLFGLLHSRFSDPAIAKSANASIGITIAFFAYLIPSVFSDSLSYSLPEVYSRGVAAFTILLSTSVVVTVIFHWVYTLKHRDQQVQKAAAEAAEAHLGQTSGAQAVAAPVQQQGMATWAKVLLIVLGVLFGFPLLMAILVIIFLSFSRMM